MSALCQKRTLPELLNHLVGAGEHCGVVADLKRVIGPTGCIERLPKGLSMGETGGVALLRPIFVVTHYWAGNLRTENLRNLYGVEGGTLTKVVASDKQSEPMLDRQPLPAQLGPMFEI